MRSFWTTGPIPHYPTRIHPALTSSADECFSTLARLLAYVGVLALLAIAGIHLWDELWAGLASERPTKMGWSVAVRSYPAFAVSQFDSPEKTEVYQIFRHPEGGRKDVLRWTVQGEKPIAELEIYRPGGEFNQMEAPFAGIAARMPPAEARDLEPAGVVDSKFGAVTLLRYPGDADGARSCLGFVKRLDQSRLQISGWSCQGDALPARRAAIGCILNRLILLTAGNEPKLAELFARAELKRGSCAASATSAASVDWLSGAENLGLRGTL
jgi:hypothetical protein